jgi:gliding motility-associated-like protein
LTVLSSNTTAATCGNANGTAAVIISGGTSPYGYNWNTPSPQTASTATGLAASSWVVTVTDAKGCALTQSVVIPAPPLPNVTASLTTPNCNGETSGSATLIATGVGPFTYNWNPSGQSGDVLTGVGAAVYSATIADNNGCLTFTTVNITQPNLLILNASLPQTICFGQQANVFAVASGGSPAYTYSWTDPTGAITGTTGGPYPNLTPTVSTQYTVSVIDSRGCGRGPNVLMVNVRPQLLAAGTSSALCDKLATVLYPNIVSPGAGGQYTYNWSNGATTPTLNVTSNYGSSPNVYSVTISDGCTVPNAQAVFSLIVNPVPTATIQMSNNKGCAPLSVTYAGIGDSTTTNNNPFFWTSSLLGNLTNPFANPLTLAYPNAGTYTIGVLVTNKYGCTTSRSESVAAIAYPVPIANFIANPPSTSILNPEIKFTNTSQGAVNYVWDFGNHGALNNTSNVIHPSYVYGLVGNYNVYLVAINARGCSDTVMQVIEITPDVSIYIPNAFTPDENGTNDTFHPYGIGIKEDPYKMDIFDRWGELIFTSNTFAKGWTGKVKGSDVVAKDGVYIYQISIMTTTGDKKLFTGHVTLIKQ